jgi:hypothetical protein
MKTMKKDIVYLVHIITLEKNHRYPFGGPSSALVMGRDQRS